MKSTFKKLIAATAVSLAFAAPASAAIGTGDGATLFLEAFDTVSQTSYTRDLGVSMNNFGTQNRPTGGFTTILDDQVTDSFVSATDANFAAFLAASTPANVIWDVIAVDNNGSTAADQKRVVFTSLSNVTGILAGAGVQWSNNGLNTSTAVESTHVFGANALLAGNPSAFTTNPVDPGNYQTGKFNNLGGGLGAALVSTAAGLGQSMGFYYATRSGTLGGNEVLSAAYKLGTGEAFQWTLDGAGNLSYGVAVAAPVPEPGTMALFVAGALMLGGMARRRMS